MGPFRISPFSLALTLFHRCLNPTAGTSKLLSTSTFVIFYIICITRHGSTPVKQPGSVKLEPSQYSSNCNFLVFFPGRRENIWSSLAGHMAKDSQRETLFCHVRMSADIRSKLPDHVSFSASKVREIASIESSEYRGIQVPVSPLQSQHVNVNGL